MITYQHNRIINTIDSEYIHYINDLKSHIANNSHNYLVGNIKLYYNLDGILIIPEDTDKIIQNIIYNLTIVPIKCTKHIH